MTTERNKLVLSVCIPAYNEEGNIGSTIDSIASVLHGEGIPFEFVIADDNSKDRTAEVVRERMNCGIPIRMIHRTPPGGFGRAIRACLDHFTGDVVVLVMADLSDEPRDIVTYYRLIEDGNDAVFGSRFMPGSVVSDYPRVKLLANRMGNTLIRMLFRTHHNDLTNAFKAYRAEVVRALMPLYGSHFNVLIELSLGALIRNYRIATCPINWYGRKWGRANFRIRELGRRYFATLIRAYAERIFILDDVLAEHAKTVRWLREPASMVESVEANIGHEKDSSHGRGGFRWKQSSVSA